LDLRRGEARHIGKGLGVLDLAVDIAARERPVALAEDRLRVIGFLARRLLLVPAPEEGLVEHIEQIGPLARDLVPHRDRARELAEAAALGRMQHEEAGHVAAIGVKIEPLVRLIAAPAGAFGDNAEILHIPYEITDAALRAGRTEMLAHAPIDEAQLVLAVALIGKAAEQLEAASIFEPLARHREQR